MGVDTELVSELPELTPFDKLVSDMNDVLTESMDHHMDLDMPSSMSFSANVEIDTSDLYSDLPNVEVKQEPMLAGSMAMLDSPPELQMKSEPKSDEESDLVGQLACSTGNDSQGVCVLFSFH